MPFKVQKVGKKYCVKSPTRTLGCHKSKRSARKQQKAVYANYKKKER